MNQRIHVAACALATGLFTASATAELMIGPCAEVMFGEFVAEVGGTYEPFDEMTTGMNLTTQMPGVTFASISTTGGAPAGPFHVEVSANNWGPNAIVGSPCDPGCVDDGRVRYEMVFDAPQRWAGVVRRWGPGATTEFYNASGALLGEHMKTDGSHEFVGYVAETADTSGWVKRIEIDCGEIPGRPVGYTDNLHFGTGDVSGASVTIRIEAGLQNFFF